MEAKKGKSKIIILLILLVLLAGALFISMNPKTNFLGKNVELVKSKYVDLTGIYVDKSDEKEHPDQALLYVLYTVKSDDKNIRFYTYMANNPGTALTIKINDLNEYKDTYTYTTEMAKNFKHTEYEHLDDGQQVLSGTSMKCIGAFRVAKNDLKEGGIIKLTLVGTDSFEEVFEYRTDDVLYLDNAKEILKTADIESYEKAEKINQENRADISPELERQIRTALEGIYEWYISTVRFEIEFSKDRFTVTSKISGTQANNGGTYEIKNKVILLHYDTGITNEMQYEFVNGEVNLLSSPE